MSQPVKIEVEGDIAEIKFTIRLYATLPLSDVVTDYEGELKKQGDLLRMRVFYKGGYFHADLVCDQVMYVAGIYSPEETAKILAQAMQEKYPQPWALFAAKCFICNEENMVKGRIVKCIYGVKPKQ
jgi:hypothetical protein